MIMIRRKINEEETETCQQCGKLLPKSELQFFELINCYLCTECEKSLDRKMGNFGFESEDTE